MERKMGGLELAFFIKLKVNPELRRLWDSTVDKRLNSAEPWTSADAERFRSLLQSLEHRNISLKHGIRPAADFSIEKKKLTEIYTFEKEGELLHWYLNVNHFTVLALDDLGEFISPVIIPREIFKLSTVECLSLRNNGLRRLPADVGRLRSLKKLVLTGNKLRSDIPALPFTLTFCRQLETLHLDCNSLDAVPGIVTLLPSLATLYRHDNENYFRTTFMWYGWERKERVHPAWRLQPAGRLPLGGAPRLDLLENEADASEPLPAAAPARAATPGSSGATMEPQPQDHQPLKLRYLAARAVAQTRLNFFELPVLSTAAQDYVAAVYHTFHVCENCNTALTCFGEGFYTFSFRSIFLGNTCVPFQHWSCSEQCARAIEQATRAEEMLDPDLHHRYYDVEEEDAYMQQPQCPLDGPIRIISLPSRNAARSHRCSVF